MSLHTQVADYPLTDIAQGVDNVLSNAASGARALYCVGMRCRIGAALDCIEAARTAATIDAKECNEQ